MKINVPNATNATTKANSVYIPSTNLSQPIIDWSNYTGNVRFQGLCGACYAITTVNNFESLLAIYSYGFVPQLSSQQIIDCANNSLTFGCDGGYL